VSLRPRFAADGRLQLPAGVDVLSRASGRGNRGDVVGEIAFTGYDPFERVASDLLLAEEFARADLVDRTKAKAWYEQHGVLDLQHLFPDDEFEARDFRVDADAFHDATVDVAQQQANVRWHLDSLVRLSDHLEDGTASRPGLAPSEAWDPAWAQPVIRGPGELLWLGGATNEEAHIESLMQHAATPQHVFRGTRLEDLNLPQGMKPRQYERWWRLAHAAYERILAERVPMLWVPGAQWERTWLGYNIEETPTPRWALGRMSADWLGLVELERRLLEPYVRRAAERDVELRRVGFEEEVTRESASRKEPFPGPLGVYERRRWTSVLAPVYVQLLEGLIRVTEGQRGAAICRECGNPFLTLDARRSSFCTDRERYRHGQRMHRARQRGVIIIEKYDDPESEAQAEAHIREHPPGAEEPEE